MKISQKGFVIPIIIAIVAVIALGGGYYYTQKSALLKDNNKIVSTTDEIKDWKTYTNTSFGFSFKYPADWYIDDNLTTSTCCLNITNYNAGAEKLFSGQTHIQIQEYKKTDLMKNNTPSDVVKYIPMSEIGGLKISAWSHPDTKNKSQAIIQKIISTFKFISTKTPSCESKTDGQPIITSISTTSGPIGTILEIGGCNLSGFEGDLDVVFEKTNGQKIILTDNFGSYIKTGDKLIKVEIKEPCQKGEKVVGRYSGIESVCDYVELTPGLYKVYVEPWGKKSNVVNFEIKSTLTQSSITIISPNGGEIIPYGQITMAGDLMFRWSTSEGDKYKPSTKITISIIDVNGIIVRDNEFNTISDIGNGIFVSSFIGENKIKSNTKYKIKICDFIAGKNICDSSDNYFLIK